MNFKEMDDISQYDDVLYSILKDCGNLPNFLDIVFGFLSRRTDLYLVTNEKNSPVGLPEGYAEKFVKTAFFKWKAGAYSRNVVPPAKQYYETITPSTDDVEINIETDAELRNTELLPKNDAKNSEESFFTSSESYNGSNFGHYAWSQTINEICILIKVPNNVTPKMLDINVTTQTISVKDNGNILLQGELRYKIKQSDLIWSLVGSKLDIQLEKIDEVWWDCLLITEPKLDVQKIDCSRPFETLSEAAQAKIEEMQWNQERKRLGLPTSADMAQEKLLNKFHSQIVNSADP